MKKFLLSICVVITLVCSFPITANAALSAGTYNITAPTDVHSEPSKYSDIIGVLKTGNTATVISSAEDWVRISYNGGIGFVKPWNLSASSSSSSSSTSNSSSSSSSSTSNSYTTTSCNQYYKTTANVNVRSGAGTSYSIVGSCASGTTVLITSISSNGWGKYSAGWICLSYASKVSDTVAYSTSVRSGWCQDSSGNWYFSDNGTTTFYSNDMHAAWLAIYDKSSPTSYYLAISTSNCMVYVFTGSQYHWTPCRAMSCSVGKSSTPTPTGTYAVSGRGYSFDGDSSHDYTCYYWVQWNGGYMFHTVLYKKGTKTLLDGTLGSHVSNGCVRLSWDNAYWVYCNIGNGTKVRSY